MVALHHCERAVVGGGGFSHHIPPQLPRGYLAALEVPWCPRGVQLGPVGHSVID